MIILKFYLGAVGLFGLAAILIWNTSSHTRMGGSQYERRKALRVTGYIFLVAAVLVLGLAVLKQFYSSDQPALTLPPSGNSVDQAQSATAKPSLDRGPSPSKNALPDFSALTRDMTVTSPSDPAKAALMEAVRLQAQNKLDAALDKVNAVIQSTPQNANALSLRGNI